MSKQVSIFPIPPFSFIYTIIRLAAVAILIGLAALGCSDLDGNRPDGPVDSELRRCPWEGGEDLGPAELQRPGDQGINAYEREIFEHAAGILLDQESIHLVTTYEQEEETYLVRGKDGHIRFTRTIVGQGIEYTIVEQEGLNPIALTDPTLFPTYQEEIAAGSNPAGTTYPELGYEAGDERLSFIEPEDTSYPFAYERIAQLFDAPSAPDLQYCLTPYGYGHVQVGTHGALDLAESRASLVFSGPGAKKGYVSETIARQADIAPTVLALLGAGTTEGVDSRGRLYSRNLMRWQDGEVLTDIFTEPCGGAASHAIIILFDGLANSELLLNLASEGALPNFRALMESGSTFRYGAVVGYPSVSIPGHISVGTGTMNGHHGFANNMLYDREKKLLLDFDYVATHAIDYLLHPDWIDCLYYTFYSERVETIFEAVHRSFGPWDPVGGTGAFTASINEPTYVGADYSLYSLLGGEIVGGAAALLPDGPRFDLSTYQLADLVAVAQLGLLLRDPGHGVPKLTYLSFYSSDGAGESFGPHGDGLRETLCWLDRRLDDILDLYREAGAYDDTVFVLTSDHGMGMQDAGRSAPWHPALDAAGIKYIDPDRFDFLYFPVMRIEAFLTLSKRAPGVEILPAYAEGRVTGGREAVHVDLLLTDDDTGDPVEGAEIAVEGGSCAPCTGTTEEDGRISFFFEADPEEEVRITAAHPDFNDAHQTVSF